MSRFIVLTALLTCCCMRLSAVDLNKIPAEANWVLELRIEQLLAGSLGDAVRERLAEEDAQRGLAAVEALTGVKVLEDLDSIALAGGAFQPDRAAIYVRGTFAAERLVLVARMAKDYASQPYRETTIHRWLDDKTGQHQFGSVVEEGLLVIAPKAATVQRVIDVVAGAAESLADAPAFANFADADGVLVIGASEGLQDLGEMDQKARVLRHVQSARVSIAETGDDLTAQLELNAATPAAAKQIKGVLDGLRALALLHDDPNQDPALKELLNTGTVAVDDTVVRITVSLPIERIKVAIREGQGRLKNLQGFGD